MRNVVVIIKRFRELSLACRVRQFCGVRNLRGATGSGKILAELWRNTYPVGSGTGDALAETPCENLCARADSLEPGSHARLCRGKQTKRNASEP